MGDIKDRIGAVFGSLLLAAALATGLPSMAFASSRSGELGAASPQEVVERIRRAAASQDMFELAASVEPAGVQEMAEGLAFITALSVAFSGLGDGEEIAARRMAEFESIVGRYGLPGLQEDGPVDRGSLLEAIGAMEHLTLVQMVTDLAGFLESMAEEEEGINSEFLPPFEGDLVNLVIDGDEAAAEVDGERIDFVRLNGRWFARLPEPPEPSESADGAAFSASWGEADESVQAGVENAQVLALPVAREDALDESARRWYVYRAVESGAFTLATRGTGQNDGDLVLEAYLDEDFTQSVARSDSDHGGDRASESIAVGLEAGQSIHVRVSQWGFDRDHLSFHVEAGFAAGEVVAASSVDWGYAPSVSGSEEIEAAQGQVIPIGENREAWLGGDETSWFIITPPSAGSVSVTTRGTGEQDGDIRLEAFVSEPEFQSVDYSDSDLLGEYAYEIVRASLDAGQLLFVRVSQWGSDDISYRLTVEFVAD